MPVLVQFYGIAVSVNWADHPPPHIHITYAEHRASLDLRSLDLLVGHVPRRVRLLVVEWALAHRTELEAAWEAASRHEQPPTIEPLP